MMSPVAQIFAVFFRLSLISFGGVFGVLPVLERIVVTERHWLTHEAFIRAYALAQFVPGPNTVMCPMLGYQIDGWPGFLAAFLGTYLPPLAIIWLAHALYHRYRSFAAVRRLERSFRPLVVGLLASSAARLWWDEARALTRAAWIAIPAAVILTVAGLHVMRRRRFNPLLLLLGFGVVALAMHASSR